MEANSGHVVANQERDDEISLTKPLISQENYKHDHDEVNQLYQNTKDLEGQLPSCKNGASFARTCLNLTNAVSAWVRWALESLLGLTDTPAIRCALRFVYTNFNAELTRILKRIGRPSDPNLFLFDLGGAVNPEIDLVKWVKEEDNSSKLGRRWAKMGQERNKEERINGSDAIKSNKLKKEENTEQLKQGTQLIEAIIEGITNVTNYGTQLIEAIIEGITNLTNYGTHIARSPVLKRSTYDRKRQQSHWR